MLKTIQSYLWPQVVDRVRSDFNGEIEVRLFAGKHTLRVEGLTQSGGLVVGLWRKAIKYVHKHYFKQSNLKRVLILGLGGGSVVKEITSCWQSAEIDAVEIDPEIVRLGELYLGLEMSKLKLIIADVYTWIKHVRASSYDLIVVDLFSGMHGPYILNQSSTLMDVSKLLSNNGVVLINRGVFEKQDLGDFQKTLEEVFSEVVIIPTAFNKMYAMRVKA